jgi:hypothetical protein
MTGGCSNPKRKASSSLREAAIRNLHTFMSVLDDLVSAAEGRSAISLESLSGKPVTGWTAVFFPYFNAGKQPGKNVQLAK